MAACPAEPKGKASKSRISTHPTHLKRIFKRIIASDLTIKSQQRGEPELSDEEKCDVLTKLLQSSSGAFLMRFGSLLDEEDLNQFGDCGDYEVKFRVERLRKALGSKAKGRVVRNRRYECLQYLMENTDYFSDRQMRDRNPLLFESYVGQYLTEGEETAMDFDETEASLSAHIMKKMEMDRREELLKQQKQYEEEQLQESDSDSDSSTTSSDHGRKDINRRFEDTSKSQYLGSLKLDRDPLKAEKEKRMLRQELLRTMQLRFLNGEDKDFDYTKVDSNEQYDSLDIREKDEQEAYFDEEEPSDQQEKMELSDFYEPGEKGK